VNNTFEVGTVIYTIDEESDVPRLMLFALHGLHVHPSEVHALVRQAIEESIEGQHRHHFSGDDTVFRCLCAVLTSMVAVRRQPAPAIRSLSR
jgi:hypothetical protein